MKLKAIITLAVFVAALAVISACQDEASLNFKRYYSTGQTVYQTHCQNCHAADGKGLGALIPPLTDSAYLKSNLKSLPCIVKNGLTGSITVNGKLYNQAMPAQSDLTPLQTAEVLTYIANSFGNKLGLVENGECR